MRSLSFTKSKYIRFLIVIFSFFFYLPTYFDTDIWWHLKLGGELIKTGFINTLTYTCTNYIWINYSWLSDLMFYRIYSSFGFLPLAILTSIVFLAGVIINYKTFQYLLFKEKGLSIRNNFSFLAFSIVNLFLLWFFLYVRPQDLSFLFFSLVLLIFLKTYYEGMKIKYLVLIGILMTFWANLHGSFIIVFPLIGIFMLTNLLEIFNEALNNKRISIIKEKLISLRSFFYFFLLSIIFPLFNPFGFDLWKEAISSIFSPLNSSFITEWASIDFHKINSIFYLLVIISIIGLIIYNKSRSLIRLLLLTFAIFIGFYSVRYQLIADVIIGMSLFIELSSFLRNLRERFDSKLKKKLEKSLKLLIIFFTIVLLIFSVINLQKLINTSSDIVKYPEANNLPSAAVKFIKTHPDISKLRFFNEYAWGGYLEFVYPGKKWFVDGRMSNWRCSLVEDSNILNDTLQIEHIGPDFNKVINTYQIKAILINSDSALSVFLDNSRDWTKIYSDSISDIFIKSS